MKRVITAVYNLSSIFIIPDDLKLLSKEDNQKANDKTVGAWWIKFDTLYYVDETLKIQEIEPASSARDVQELIGFNKPDRILKMT